jgi:FlaA1/EpsC-like NDP-sugar epimerase
MLSVISWLRQVPGHCFIFIVNWLLNRRIMLLNRSLLDTKFYIGIFVIPIFWIMAYAFTGTYSDIFRKSRLKEFGQTLYISVIGVLIIFFTLLLDDSIISYKNYYSTFFTLLGLHFILTAIVRFVLTTITGRKIKTRKIGFNTLLIGSNQKALKLYNELEKAEQSQGNIFVGFIHVDQNNGHLLKGILPHLRLNQ